MCEWHIKAETITPNLKGCVQNFKQSLRSPEVLNQNKKWTLDEIDKQP